MGLITSERKRRAWRWALCLALGAFALWLFAPAGKPRVPKAAPGTPFTWKSDDRFAQLEQVFQRARRADPATNAAAAEALVARGRTSLARLRAEAGNALDELERIAFEFGALAAADGDLLPSFQHFVEELRDQVRGLLAGPDEAVFPSVYRLLHGGRMALEEAWVQNPARPIPSLRVFDAPPAATPAAEVRGVQVHSGDLALSRGGAPTSALIARGSDFPGSFSHAALVHVDGTTGAVSVIESLIEKGAVVTPLEEYLQDPKRRILLLRLRPEALPDPQAPHRAAEAMLRRVQAHPIPYDFAMDWRNDDALFCSEVPYHAYRAEGVELWAFKSPMSAPGLAGWLASFGTRHFTTLVPSALEYDSKLVPVAEWCREEALLSTRYDDATIDALLERAESGLRLEFPYYKLPLARLAKLYSVLVHAVGLRPVIPQGITPAQALRVDTLNHRLFPAVRDELERRADIVTKSRGYPPPYWQLVAMAREIASAL